MLISTLLFAFTMQAAEPAARLSTVSDSNAVPKRSCITPERTGTFRVVATRMDGHNGVLALLLLENIDGCLEATFVTDDRGPAAIEQLSLSSNTLKGRLNLTGEIAAFTVRFEDNRIAGAIVARKQEWRIEGRKTS